MFNGQDLMNTICQSPNLFELTNTSTTWQVPPTLRSTISTALSTVPYNIPIESPRVDTYYPMYPCPHKDLFRIARQIDKMHDLECQYRHDSHTFIIKDTEKDRTLGVLGKDNIANQIVLQCDGYNDRSIRLITLDLDCDLLALIQIGGPIIRGLYKVNSVE